MVSIVARFRMQPSKEEKALERLREMVEAVQANEPGALVYLFHRSQQEPSEIVLFEAYAGAGAFQAHMQTLHMGEFQASFSELFDTSQVKIERPERLGGFVRSEAG